MKKFTFKKSERLTSRRIIGDLVSSGRSFTISPFRVYWMPVAEERKSPVQVAISVSKRRFKKAVIRNKIKRSIKEAYRKNKEVLGNIPARKTGLSILLVYISDEVLSYSIIEKKLIIMFQRLISANEKSS